MLKNYLFFDDESGENFICQAENIESAEENLVFHGFDLLFLHHVRTLTDFEAEMAGLDVY